MKVKLLKASIIALVMFLTFVAAFVCFVNMKMKASPIALERREAIAYLSALYLKEKFDGLVSLGGILVTDPQVKQFIAQKRWGDAIGEVEYVLKDTPTIDRIFFTNLNGMVMSVTEGDMSVVGQNFSYRDWFTGVTTNWLPYVSEVYQRASKPQYNIVSVAVPIKDDFGEPTGIMVMQIKLDQFLEWSRKIDVGKDGTVYFVDKKGHVAGHPDYTPQGKIVNLVDIDDVRKAMTQTYWLTKPMRDYENVTTHTLVPDYDWEVVVQQPTDEAFAAFDESSKFLFGVYGMLGVLSTLFTFAVVHITFSAYKNCGDTSTKMFRSLKSKS